MENLIEHKTMPLTPCCGNKFYAVYKYGSLNSVGVITHCICFNCHKKYDTFLQPIDDNVHDISTGQPDGTCSLSDLDLIKMGEQWVRSLLRSGGKSWSLRVPADYNQDPDMIFTEIISRFKKFAKEQPENLKYLSPVQTPTYQPLFNYLTENFGYTALGGEMSDLIQFIKANY